ncbi:MAG: HNH endonuclease [Leptospirillum sp.]
MAGKYCQHSCYVKGHFKDIPIAQRLSEKSIRRENGCIEWTGALTNGYGYLGVKGKGKRAHVLAYEVYKGPIPPGLFVCHHCDNRKCLNPHHLFLGTPTDNAQDAVKKGRWIRGSRVGSSKLKQSDIEEIFLLRSQGWTQRAIADKFGVTNGLISMILSGKRWKYSKLHEYFPPKDLRYVPVQSEDPSKTFSLR